MTIFMSIGAALTGSMGSYMAAATTDPTNIMAVLTPSHLLIAVSAALLAGLQYAIILSTAAVAYRDLGPERGLVA